MRKGLLVGVIVLAGLVVAADRVGLKVAQNEIAKNVASQYQLDHRPAVKIKGFPFLTQAYRGSYDEIDVNVGALTQQGIRLTKTTVVLKGVKAPMSDALKGDSSKMTATKATTTATVGYDDVDKEAPRGMTVSANGTALQVHGPVTVLGVSRDVTATVTVQPAGRSVRVLPQTVNAGGATLPVGLIQQAFSFTLPVKGLPLGTRISDVRVKPEGLQVSTTADDVKLSSLNAR